MTYNAPFESHTPRIAGSEVEYGNLMSVERTFRKDLYLDNFVSPPVDALDTYHVNATNIKTVYGYMDKGIEVYYPLGFLSTGDRLYLDLGEHIEFSTAECRSFSEVIQREFAGGDLIFRSLTKALSGGKLVNQYGIDRFQLNKTLSDQFYYWGYHENYLGLRELDSEGDYMLPLALHLSTRQVFAGSGEISKEGDFYVSQKMNSVRELCAGVASNPAIRPLVDQRDEPHADSNKWRRIHVSIGDAHLNRYSSWLQMVTTSVVLRIVEFGGEAGIDLKDLYLADPVAAARLIAQDPSLKKKVDLANGKSMTALELQTEICSRAIQMAEKIDLPDEEILGISEWAKVCDQLKGDPQDCYTKVEWIAKKQFIEGLMDRRGLTMNDRIIREAMLRWTDLDPTKGYGLRLGHSWQNLPGELNGYEISRPPGDTRAFGRGRLIGALGRAVKETRLEFCMADWEKLRFDNWKLANSPSKIGSVSLLDPFVATTERLEEALEQLAA